MFPPLFSKPPATRNAPAAKPPSNFEPGRYRKQQIIPRPSTLNNLCGNTGEGFLAGREHGKHNWLTALRFLPTRTPWDHSNSRTASWPRHLGPGNRRPHIESIFTANRQDGREDTSSQYQQPGQPEGLGLLHLLDVIGRLTGQGDRTFRSILRVVLVLNLFVRYAEARRRDSR